jgi:hypothetical protein
MRRGSYSSEGEDMDATPLAIGYTEEDPRPFGQKR